MGRDNPVLNAQNGFLTADCLTGKIQGIFAKTDHGSRFTGSVFTDALEDADGGAGSFLLIAN